MGDILASDIMTRNPVTISPKANLMECARAMVRKRVGSLPVVENKKLVGFISQRDILWALIKKSPAELPSIRAIDIAVKKIAIVKPIDTIDDVFRKMKKTKFERMPVVHNRELVGMITARDVLNFKPEFYPELEEFAEIKEEEEKLKRIKKAKSRSVVEEGICEECGTVDRLYRRGGMLICRECFDAM